MIACTEFYPFLQGERLPYALACLGSMTTVTVTGMRNADSIQVHKKMHAECQAANERPHSQVRIDCCLLHKS